MKAYISRPTNSELSYMTAKRPEVHINSKKEVSFEFNSRPIAWTPAQLINFDLEAPERGSCIEVNIKV